jgi:hypothetical protein
MACRKHSPGQPCCGAACVDSTSLPVSVTFGTSPYNDTVLTADWSNTNWQGTISSPCCWYALKTFGSSTAPAANRYEYQCATAYGLPGGVLDQQLVSIRWKLSTSLGITKQTCICDGNPSANQYVFYVADNYQIWAATYFVFGQSCADMAYSLSRSFLPPRPMRFQSVTQTIARKVFYPSAVTSSLILTDGSTADCDDICFEGGFGQNSLDISLTLSGITRTITWEDTSDWSVGINY